MMRDIPRDPAEVPRAAHLSCVTQLRRYGTYKLVQQMPGGEKMVAFTRILHRQKPDVLMDEVRSG